MGAELWAKLFEPVDPPRRRPRRRRRPLPDPDRYANRFAHCDVLVVGAGPAGLAAALAAAARGSARDPVRRGRRARRLAARRAATRRSTARRRADWVADALARARAPPNVHAAAAHPGLRLLQPQFRRPRRAPDRPSRAARPRARRASGCGRCGPSEVVLATGAIERPLVFPDNDRPGIMLADAARTFLNRYGVQAGQRAPSSSPRMTAPIGRRSTSHAAGVEIAAHRRSARRARRRRWSRRRGAPASRFMAGATIVGTRGAMRVARR